MDKRYRENDPFDILDSKKKIYNQDNDIDYQNKQTQSNREYDNYSQDTLIFAGIKRPVRQSRQTLQKETEQYNDTTWDNEPVSTSSKKEPPKRKKKKKHHFVRNFIVLLLVVLLAGAGYGYFYLQDLSNSITTVPLEGDLAAVAGLDEGVKNIALFGLDSRDETMTGRSDCIMILSLDKNHNQIKLASLMRDSYVEVEGHGFTKLCHAYSYGGPSLAVKTINQNYGLNITDYATVDFSAMSDIIDAVGGVEIDLDEREVSYLNEALYEQNVVYNTNYAYIETPGKQLLNGGQAVAYARIRYADSDFVRTQRQRTVLIALLNTLMDQPFYKYPALAKELLNLCETSYTLDKMLPYMPFVMKKPDIYTARYPEDGDYATKKINGTDYITFEQEPTNEKLHQFIYGDAATYTTE